MCRWTLIATLLHCTAITIPSPTPVAGRAIKPDDIKQFESFDLLEESNVATLEEVPSLEYACAHHMPALHHHYRCTYLCIYKHTHCIDTILWSKWKRLKYLISVILARVHVCVFLPRGALFTSYFISTTASSMLWTLQMSSIIAWGEGDRGRGGEGGEGMRGRGGEGGRVGGREGEGGEGGRERRRGSQVLGAQILSHYTIWGIKCHKQKSRTASTVFFST